MAIQISGSTVVDNSRNLTCIATACADSAAGNWIATQAEAEAGTDNTQVMTPCRVAQAISKLAGMKDSDINWSTCNVGCTVRGGGNVIYKSGGIIWIVAPSTAQVSSSWPMGFCNGSQGSTPDRAQRITGRSGWFIPDVEMLQTAYACRSYWDTFSTVFYWSSSEYTTSNAYVVSFSNGSANNGGKGLNCRVRPFRVVCY